MKGYKIYNDGERGTLLYNIVYTLYVPLYTPGPPISYPPPSHKGNGIPPTVICDR